MTRRLVTVISLALVICGLALVPAASARPSQDQDNSSRAYGQSTTARGLFTTLWHTTTDWVRLRPQDQATKDIILVPVPYPPYFIIIVTTGGGTGAGIPPDGAP